MNEQVIGQQEELKVAEWDVTQLRWDFVCLMHRLDLVFFLSTCHPRATYGMVVHQS